MPEFVLDASVTLAWCFKDESTPFPESVREALQTSSSCYVPPIWPSEVANGVRMAERRGRVSAAVGGTFLSMLLQYPIKVVSLPPATVFQDVLSLARTQELTVYDAFYLNLALQGGLPLATLDNLLRTAAGRVGVRLLSDEKG